MITFTKAPEVSSGQIITAAEHIKLAKAFNDRLRSGVGDCTYRIHYLLLNLWRQIRNPDTSGLVFPAQAEFEQYYQHLDIYNTDAQWPVAGPGEAEGTNLANPMGAFVFGNPGVESEAGRLTGVNGIPLWINGHVPQTDDEAFTMGQFQRGAYDPTTGALGSPSFTAAQAFYRIVQPYYSPMGKAYGGFMPIPQIVGDCGDSTETSGPTPKYQIFFTPLKTGLPVKYYVGFCPLGDNNTGQGQGPLIVFISRSPFAYYIYRADGIVERLERKDYIEGPYTGGAQLAHTDGEWLPRVLNRFIGDFRGTPGQRQNEAFNIEDIAFSFQEFFSTQYFLAPNIGHVSGSSLIPDYPSFTFGPASTLAQGTVTGTHAYRDGFVLGGVRLKATKLSGSVTVEILNGSTVLGTVTLTADVLGNSVSTKWFPNGPVPNPLKFRLATIAAFTDGTGTIICDATEQLRYQPEIHDAYMLLRCASSKGMDDEVDTRGMDYPNSKQIFDDYSSRGCVTQFAGQSSVSDTSSSININPVFDAARRLTRDNTRVIPRDQFVGYEVTNGKSILYFKRYALGDSANQADSFDNIAGGIEPIASGGVRDAYRYIVRTGSIRYNGVAYNSGDAFIGVPGVSDFDAASGGQIYELTGIRSSAPPRSTTNEWLMFPQFKVYSQASTNPFKESAYSDYFALNERCHFYSGQVTKFSHRDMVDLFNYGTQPMISPESPTGWRFAKGSNDFTRVGLTDDQRTAFYKSCRIYEPDAEIESAVAYIEGGTEFVKVTFKSRLHHCDEAPSSIPKSVAAWDQTALRNESYRSIENGLREYLLKQNFGIECRREVLGDTGLGLLRQSDFWPNWDGVFGACYPHFFFTRLVETPFEDTPPNQTVETDSDTLITFDRFNQMEFYLYAMCQGFVDGQSSINYACTIGVVDMFDYTFENLMFDASQNTMRWFSLLPTAFRPDQPQGFHALPNVEIDAERISLLSKAINKLTRARIMLPMKMQCKNDFFTGHKDISPNVWFPDGLCNGAGVNRAISTESPPSAGTLVSLGQWQDCSAVGGRASARIAADCNGTNFQMISTRSVGSFRFDYIDPLSINAIPENLRDMIQGTGTGFVGRQIIETAIPVMTVVGTSAESQGCCFAFQEPCPGFFWDGVKGWKFSVSDTQQISCALFSGGTLDGGSAPAGDFYLGRSAGGADCFNSSDHGISIVSLGDNPIPFIEVPLV